jgi:hypothetical protein
VKGPEARRVPRASLAALGLYVLLVLASFYPQSLRPADTIAYIGDSLESVYIVAWNVHQLFHDPRHLFDANILYPTPRAMTFTDHRLLPSVLVAPVIALTGNPVLACNVGVALACLLAAMAARHVARRLGLDLVSAWTVGALYGFHTYQVNEAPRLNIVFHGFLVLALGELVSYLAAGRARHAWGVAGLLLLQGLSSNYHLLYGAFLVGLVTLSALVVRPRAIGPRLPLLVLAGVVAFAAFLPIALPYVQTTRAHALSRELPEGMGLEHYVSTVPTNLVYGAMGAEVRLQQRAAHFIGFVPMVLAVAALVSWARRRDVAAPLPELEPEAPAVVSPQVWVPAAAVLALLLILLSLGRDVDVVGHHLMPGPYRLLYQYVPGFQLVRIPERLGLLAMLFIALLAGRGLALVRRAGWSRVALILAAAVPAEHLSTLPKTERVPIGRAIPQVYRFLADYPAHAVVEVPTRGEGLVRRETVEAYFSTVHWKPIVQGYTAYPPLLSRLLRRAADDFPAEWSRQAFGRVGVNTAVVHHGRRSRPGFEAEIAGAVSAGLIVREARFDGPAAHLFESEADEVYRLLPVVPRPGAPWPRGHRLRDPQWRYSAKYGDAARAADGDLSTAWVATEELRGDEYLAVDFGGTVEVAGLVLPLRRDTVFPTQFRIIGQEPDGRRRELAHLTDAHKLQLVDELRSGATAPALAFDLKGRPLTGLMLQVGPGGTSFDGWSVPELEVWVP